MRITRERLEARCAEVGIPDYMRESLVEYVLTGRPVGHFLTAVLSNDLREACMRGDEVNQRALHLYVFFLYNYAPIGCWGNSMRVTKWIEQRGMQDATA